jgi:hypothetical protein
MNNLFYVGSSNGELQVDVTTGVVVSVNVYTNDSGLEKINSFDVKEWEEYYGKPIPVGEHIDILDLGYWHDNGKYTHPEFDAREEIKRRWEDGK